MITDRVQSNQVRHYAIVLLVFAVTGSIAVLLSRLVIGGVLGLEGSVWGGPWSYRLAYLATIPPAYSLTLVAVGTLFGKREYFSRRAMRVWGPLLRLVGRVGRPGSDGRRR